MAFRFALKFGLEVLTGNALSAWLEFIDETIEKVFLFTMDQTENMHPHHSIN